MLEKSDIPIAHKALNIVGDLSSAGRQVGGALIDHFNKKTSQCDPSLGRLSQLLGINEKTVRRATEDLCEQGFFRKVSHGGRSHRASYTPNWGKFREIVAEWHAKMKGDYTPSGDGSNRAEMSGSTGQECPVEPDKNVHQTYSINLTNKPIGIVLPCGTSARATISAPQESKQRNQRTGRNGLGNGNTSTGQRKQSKVAASPSHQQAARAAAERRVNQDLMALGLEPYADAIERMSSDDQDAATAAEIRRRGGGIALLFERLGILGQQRREGVTDAIH